MRILVSLLLQLLCLQAFASVERIKLHSFNEVSKKISNEGKNSLVILDIDGVILCPRDAYLSHNNRTTRNEFLDKVERTKGKAERKKLYELIIAQLEYKLVEPDLIKNFWLMKYNGYDIIALTSMGPNNTYCDQEQDRVNILKDRGLLFNKKFKGQVQIDGQKRPQPIAIEGVIFARGYEKGQVLKAYIDQQKTIYHQIIMVDDMAKNLDSVEKYLEDHVKKLVLIEYAFDGFENKNDEFETKDFSEKISAVQKTFLIKNSIWLTDRQAAVILQLTNKTKSYKTN